MSLMLLNPAAGVHGVLQTRAPRACAICMMPVSQVLAASEAEVELAGAMWLRNSERPTPVKGKFVVPSKEVPTPLFVEKNISAWFVVQLPSHADDAPKPSMRWKTVAQSTVHAPLVMEVFTGCTTRSSI